MVVADSTVQVLEEAVTSAKRRDSLLILASTTGASAKTALGLIAEGDVRLVVVTHDARRLPKESRFDDAVLSQLQAEGHAVVSSRAFIAFPLSLLRKFYRRFRFFLFGNSSFALSKILGVGGRVCVAIVRLATRQGLIREGETVVAVAGEERGLDTALAIKVKTITPFQIDLLEIIARSSN